MVTLTSSIQGAICPGDEVTFTCNVTEEYALEWSSPAFDSRITYYYIDVGYVREHGIFTATLTSVIRNPQLLYDLTSTIRVTVTPEAMLNGTILTCSGYFSSYSTDTTITLAGNNPLDVPEYATGTRAAKNS